ncbi:MAG: FAD-dependent oxidoreductase [Oscillospiraceae bacterium]|nr:FAD-dependent oxidoreductase [Oscillospiraceae bacterium]
MKKIKVEFNAIEVCGFEGQTILEIARENDIDIPSLCHDKRVEMYASCGVCTVEVQGNPRLLRACSTLATDGMKIETDTVRVQRNRKAALELLLSDHKGDCRAPCTQACPAQTDCQGYVGLIANGEYKQALKLIMEEIPLPASIGRVCPHPCEEACRRELVEEPVSIAALKRYVGDMFLENREIIPPVETSGKSVAIIGGGPGGLSAAYFLRQKGYAVTIYDAMPAMGGMLRYGIPEYRLPKELLSLECNLFEQMGVVFKNNIRVGRDITLDKLRKDNDAVIIAVGAWASVPLRCKGEELDGVLGGIDFLRDTNLHSFAGKKIAVVGGGNTAMDACRTAVRLGADKVYNIYRRTVNEMPAEKIEIDEALEEGVIFKNLTNPIEIIGENGKVKAINLQLMELGEPDESGRRAPVPCVGKEELLQVDFVIAAIGQKLNSDGLDGIELTKWKTILADTNTFATNISGVFAIGDAVNDGASIAIKAIGDAKKAAKAVAQFLRGGKINACDDNPQFLVKDEKTAADFADKEKQARGVAFVRPANERKKDFSEIGESFTQEDAVKEANRCLECGCHDYFECKLLKYANRYDVTPQKYAGESHNRATQADSSHPHIKRNPDKCILCGLCVRICEEVVGTGAIGLVGRGFDTEVKPALGQKLEQADCISCGQCVNVCPTGALTESLFCKKQVPLKEVVTQTTCEHCSLGCGIKQTRSGDLILRHLPIDDNSFLCKHGRFPGEPLTEKSTKISPAIEDIRAAKSIIIVEPDKIYEYGAVAIMEANRAARKGAKLTIINDIANLPSDIPEDTVVIKVDDS